VDLAIGELTYASEPSRQAIDDARSVRAALAGDRRAFEALYRAHVGRVRALCLRLSAHAAIADELTQEAFVRAWQRLSTFRGDSAFATWLHRLTVNVVFDHQRAERPWYRRLASLDDEVESVAAIPARSVGAADQHDLENAICRLPRGARTVFVLHDVEGWKHDEIAARVGIAVGTSKAHLHRARTLLKEWLSL
jgi:RNA polymerase sigma factor (sigma-70 family)